MTTGASGCSATGGAIVSRGAGEISTTNCSSASTSTGGAWGASGATTAVLICSSLGGSGELIGASGAFGGSTFGGGAVNTGRWGTTVAGVMKRGLGADGGSAAGAAERSGATDGGSAGGAAGAAALVTTTRGGVAGAFPISGGRGETADGRAAQGGCSFCSMIARSASPGLEIFDRSILGRSSSELARWRASRPEPCCSRTYLRTRSASSSSMELEWVFFSVTPTFGRTSRISLLFISSSLAKSLIRIFIRLCISSVDQPSSPHVHLTVPTWQRCR